MQTKDEITCIAQTGFLGYGFSVDDFKRAVNETKPDFLAVDAGSTDQGPYYLGSGDSFTTYETVKQELELIIGVALKNDIPFIIGSAGGRGGRPHVDWTLNIIRAISKENKWSLPIATIDGEIDKDTLSEWVEQKRIKEFDRSEERRGGQKRRTWRGARQE